MNKKNIIIVVICLVIFFIFLTLLLMDSVNGFDTTIYNSIMNIKSNIATYIFKFFTLLCSTEFMAGVVLGLLIISIITKNFNKGLYFSLNIGICALLNQFIKFIVHRPRPNGINMIEENGFSFPSGHTMVSVAFYGMLIYLLNKSNIKRFYKIILTTILVVFIILTGVSRVYLGVHYASDVVAALALAIAYLIIYIHLANKKMKS